MTKALTEFGFEGKAVRVFGEKEYPWFMASDIFRALDIPKNYMKRTLETLDDDEKMVVDISKIENSSVINLMTEVEFVQGSHNTVHIISEPGLYKIMFRSRTNTAKVFTRWVTHEVLPSIRKYGYYVNPKWGEIPETGKWKLADGRELRGDEIQELAKQIGCDYVENKKISQLVDEIDEYSTIEGKKKRYPYREEDIQRKVSSHFQEANWYECFVPEGANWAEYVCYFKDKRDAFYSDHRYIILETAHYSEKFAELVRQVDETYVETE